MFNRWLLYLVIVSNLVFCGCLIKGRVVYENGVGVAGVTVTLSGSASLTTVTDINGDYQFGTQTNMLTAGSYTITPTKSVYNLTPSSQSVTISTQTLGGLGDVPWPVSGVDFEVSAEAGLSFSTRVDYDVGGGPNSVAIGDLNGDGDLDLVITNLKDNNVSVLLGNGDGTFQSAINSEAGDWPDSVATGDIDGDGDLDLAVANNTNYSTNGVSVMFGNGDGTFQTPVYYGLANISLSVAIGDLDEDANLDLAVANNRGGYVSVLLGKVDGTFQIAAHYGVGHPGSVAIGDINGDGDMDLATADSAYNNVSVLLGNGDGTFQSPANYGAGDGPRSIAIGDLDGDGDMDLAVVNYDDDNVSVLINLSQLPIESGS